MELNEIIPVVEKKAEEIAEQEIVKYSREFPELNLTDEARASVKQRAISQLTLELSKFRFKPDMNLQEQFDEWFAKTEQDDLQKACKHCLDDEANKIRNANGKNLSSLDKYLKKHLGDAHTVDQPKADFLTTRQIIRILIDGTNLLCYYI